MRTIFYLLACCFAAFPGVVLAQPVVHEYVKFGDRLWSRCSYGQVLSNGQCTGQAQRVSHDKLRAVVTETNARFEDGSGSWVIPSIHELAELLHCDSGAYRSKDIVAQGLPAIDNWCDGSYSAPTTHLAQFPDTLPSIYWSSTPALKRTPSSWVMNFKDGYIMDHPNTHEFYVRLLWAGGVAPRIKKPAAVTPVKVEAPLPAATQGEAKPRPAVLAHLRVTTDGTSVHDTQTGLMWSRCSYGQKWNGQACTGVPLPMTVDGVQAVLLEANVTEKLRSSEAWRLPTVRELMSLVQCSSGVTRFSDDPEDGGGKIDNWCDGSFDRPTISRELFPDTPARRYWTASSYQGKATANWGVLFNTGRMSADLRSEKNFIRLVRSVSK
jgi:hypothetical protein